MARIYNQGIEERVATFETRPRAAGEVRSWFGGRHPVVVVEEGGDVLAFAALLRVPPPRMLRGRGRVLGLRRPRGARAGRRRHGDGGPYLRRRAGGVLEAGLRVFVENAPSRRLLRSAGFREVGVYERHAKLDGAWKDVVIVERLIPSNL